MIFGPDLIPAVLNGRKTVTRRRAEPGEPCRYRVGHTYAIQPGRGKMGVGRLRVIDLVRCPLRGVMGVGEAQREGFASAREFLDYWERLAGRTADLDREVWRIEFEVVS